MNILNQITCGFPVDLHSDRISSITEVPALSIVVESVIKCGSSPCREGIYYHSSSSSLDVPGGARTALEAEGNGGPLLA